MNPVSRMLGFAVLVVLTALLALLAAPVVLRERPAADREPAADARPLPAPGTARAVQLRERTTLVLAAAGTGLAVALVFSLYLRGPRLAESPAPLRAARTELGALARLAESSVAQGAELHRERDGRLRAEQDAELRQQLLTQALEEKIRLGRDLHDGIIQSLYAVGLTLESVRTLVRADPDEADRRLEQTRSAINATLRDVRAYIIGLAPENLRREGFAQALQTLVLELQAGRDVRFDVKIDDEAAARLTPDQGLEMLQIVREAVSNALRHGGASMVTLRVHPGERELCVLVQDNGVGFDPTRRREGGHGLGNMHARVERVGGRLDISSQPGQGVRIVITLPFAPTASA